MIGVPEGEGPDVEDSDLVTLMTEFATVVVSVLLAVFVPVSAALTTMVPVWPAVALAGITPATTYLNCVPAGIGPVLVMGVELSGTPSPLASM